jgi:hypothetical protein
VSEDQVKTFAAPVTWPVKDRETPKPANPVVLTDGTLVLSYGLDTNVYGLALDELERDDPKARRRIPVLLSRDGGKSLQQGTPVCTYWRDDAWFPFPQLAVDTASKKYQDRLYAVWTDGVLWNRRSPQVRIMFSFSNDKARSWAKPQILSEQPASPEGGKDYAAFLPSIAVNKNGVIAVSWYDRRGLADQPIGGGYLSGWNLRLRVSLDGGEIWQSSVQVNEKTGKDLCKELRETAGLAADAEGNFHPVWIDDRTGKRQVWTTIVSLQRE